MFNINSRYCPGCRRLPHSFLRWLGRLRWGLMETSGLGATPGSWLRLRWHQYGWRVVAQLVSSMLRSFLLSMAWRSWPSLVHVQMGFLVSCDDLRSGALSKLDRRYEEEMHIYALINIHSHTLTLLSGEQAPALFVPWMAWAALTGSGGHAGTWGNARQLAQIEMAPVRVELLSSSRR